MYLGLPGDQFGEYSREPQSLSTELRPHPLVPGTGCIAFVEHQVQHSEDRAQSARKLFSPWNFENRFRGGQRLLRADYPLLHRRRRREERFRNLFRGQTAHHPKRQRHLRFSIQHGMAGDEHQAKDIVVDAVRIPADVVEM